MLSLIPLLPFIGFLANLCLGRRLSKPVSGGLASATMLGAFSISLGAAWRLLSMPVADRVIQHDVFTWIASGDFTVELSFRLDPLSTVMILVVTGIGALIHVYSTAYMHDERDAEYARYFSYLNLFAAFMLVLVLGSNFLVMFVGWEGVGLCSYLLIGFWYEKASAAEAGKKAFVVNRIGDFAFILGMLMVFVRFGTLDFQEVARAAEGIPVEAGFGALSVLTLLLFIGATGKSAQIPLYVWLPDAMEGPTPVSALIHAATMVTAGVYMIGRNAVLFGHTPEVLGIVAVIGAATALWAGTIGLVQNDIKRVLAYSTVSQLGYMFLAMGVGAFAAGIFHLLTHAFFKALLFLGAGAVIHALAGEQDLRRMGGLRRELPVTYWTFLTGALAIAGVPLLSGFFSKDEILFRTFASGHIGLWLVAALTALLTAVYMFRLVVLAFHGEHRGPAAGSPDEPAAVGASMAAPTGHGLPEAGGRRHDAPPAMAIPLVLLAVGSIVAGYVGVPHALGGSNRIEEFLAPSFGVHVAVDEIPGATDDAHASADEGLELALTGVSSIIALVGIGVAVLLFLKRPEVSAALQAQFAGFHRVLLNKYYVDEIYDATIVQPIKIIARDGLWRRADARLIDGVVNGVGALVARAGALLRRLQTGSVRAYATSLLVGVLLILGYLLW